jgi:cation transport ATPase
MIGAMQSIPDIIEFTPVTLNDPVTIVRYKPSPPRMTLRVIFAALESLGFKPSLEKSPSIQERSRRLQATEQKHILWRIIAAIIIAIPTFIIGVVYMTFVPGHSSGRMYWETPIWGNASRDVVALFFLATPVQFVIAYHFHHRAFHRLLSLWRSGSGVPVWKRFVKFGSMDLLISLGTSVAYFASLALLIIAATASVRTKSYSTTFFDTTVFLTLFILLGMVFYESIDLTGRYLEGYAKHKAADAISMLSNLRPTEAILDTFGSEERVSTDLLEVGDIVKVPNGSTPPGDGIVISGSSKFDESSLAGESRPIHKDVGDIVFVGTINTGSMVTITLEAIEESSMLTKIVDIVR